MAKNSANTATNENTYVVDNTQEVPATPVVPTIDTQGTPIEEATPAIPTPVVPTMDADAPTPVIPSMDILEQLKAKAAAKYTPASVAPVETWEQRIKDATRKALANLTLSGCVAVIDAIPELPANIDKDKTASRYLADLKKAIAAISKTLQEWSAANPTLDVDLTPLTSFDIKSVTPEIITVEAAPLYKGAIVQVNFDSLSDDAKLKFANIGLTAVQPFGMISSITFDKTSNAVYARIEGIGQTDEKVRVSLKSVIAPTTLYNSQETVDAYNNKVDDESKKIVPSALKISKKQFTYVADKLRENLTEPKFLTDGLTAIIRASTPDATSGEISASAVLSAVSMYLRDMGNNGK